MEDTTGGVELLASQMGLHHAARPRAARKDIYALSPRSPPARHDPSRAAKLFDRDFRALYEGVIVKKIGPPGIL